jgi:hypothetical protein
LAVSFFGGDFTSVFFAPAFVAGRVASTFFGLACFATDLPPVALLVILFAVALPAVVAALPSVAFFAADRVAGAFAAFWPPAPFVLAPLPVALVVALPVDLPVDLPCAGVTAVPPFVVAAVRPLRVDFARVALCAEALGAASAAPASLVWDAIVFSAIAPFPGFVASRSPGEELLAVRGAEDRAGTQIPQ